MVARKSPSARSPAKVDNLGRAAAKLHRLLNELGHARGLQQTAATMPDARERLSFIDQTMHEASEKTISAVEHALPRAERTRQTCADLTQRLSGTPELARHALVQETLSRLGEIAAAQDATRQDLLQIMEAQEFRDVAGQMVNKIVDAAVEIEKILLDLLREHAPDLRHSLISKDGMTAGPVMRAHDGVSGQDEVDDLLASMGF